MSFSSELPLPAKKIARCRQVAKSIFGDEVATLIRENSTVGTERAILRLLGFNGAIQHNDLLFPSSNYIVDQLRAENRLAEGALYWICNAIISEGSNVSDLERRILEKGLNIAKIDPVDRKRIVKYAKELTKKTYTDLMDYRKDRAALRREVGDPIREGRPLKYVIVAT
jgi:beta-lysine 5,6-aminomutase alpha subunit